MSTGMRRDDPPEYSLPETELPDDDDYWLSWPDTLAEQRDPDR